MRAIFALIIALSLSTIHAGYNHALIALCCILACRLLHIGHLRHYAPRKVYGALLKVLTAICLSGHVEQYGPVLATLVTRAKSMVCTTLPPPPTPFLVPWHSRVSTTVNHPLTRAMILCGSVHAFYRLLRENL